MQFQSDEPTQTYTMYRFMVVVLFLFTTNFGCYAAPSRFLNAEEKVEILNHLNRVNKPAVKSIKSPDGDIIDCVLVSNQPAFDNPVLKSHTIKMKPSYYPNLINDDNIKGSSMMNASKVGPVSSSSSTMTQLWHSNGKCPIGTIPIRRTKIEDILRAGSVKSYGMNKKSFLAATSNSSGSNGHEYATAQAEGRFYGTKVTMNVWNPNVQKNSNEFSLGQLWLTAGPTSDLNTIEAGWQVYPYHYGDNHTRLFIYWTNDGYKNTACYNLECSGFVQTSNKIAIGGSLSPSQIDGDQHDITILIYKDPKDGNWWMQFGKEHIGYWPSLLFSYLNESASTATWGGEVVNTRSYGHHTTTQMGSGHFPAVGQGLGKVSYFKNIQTLDDTSTLKTPDALTPYTPEKTCYDIKIGMDNEWGSFFYFGGPGRNEQCK